MQESDDSSDNDDSEMQIRFNNFGTESRGFQSFTSTNKKSNINNITNIKPVLSSSNVAGDE